MGEVTKSGNVVSLTTARTTQMEVATRQMQSILDYLESLGVYSRQIENCEEFRRTLNDDNVAVMCGQIVGIEASTPPLQGAMQEVWHNAKPFGITKEPTCDCLWGGSISIIFRVVNCFVEYFAYDGPLDWRFVAELSGFRQTIEAMINIEENRLKFAIHGVQPNYHLQYDNQCYASLDKIVIQIYLEEGGASEFTKFHEKPLNLDTRNAIMNTLERYEAIRMMKELEPKMRQLQISYLCKVKKDDPTEDKKKAHPYDYADMEEFSLFYFVWDNNGERWTCHPDANGVKLMMDIIAEKEKQLKKYTNDGKGQYYSEDDPDWGAGDSSNECKPSFLTRIGDIVCKLLRKL